MTHRDIIDALRASWGQIDQIAFYEQLAEKLSRIASQDGRAWTWRYVQSAYNNTLGHPPGRRFLRALEILAAEMDGLPTFIADTEPVSVQARPGAVQENSIVIGKSKTCEYPPCTIHFIPRVPWQKYCPLHQNPKNRSNHK